MLKELTTVGTPKYETKAKFTSVVDKLVNHINLGLCLLKNKISSAALFWYLLLRVGGLEVIWFFMHACSFCSLCHLPKASLIRAAVE